MLDSLLAPGSHDSLVTSVHLLPDSWGRITSIRTHKFSARFVADLAARHGISQDAVRKLLEKLQ